MNDENKIKLQGHEKFPLREGWLNKGLQMVSKQKDAFTRKDAPDIFGIGNNMVKSLRYWMRALGLTNDAGTELSTLGCILLEYDQYLVNPFSWWLLHSQIAKNKSVATTWYMFFQHCGAEEMEKDQIISVLSREISKYINGRNFSEKSLASDVDVLLSMYSKNKVMSDPEDKNISPFSQLGLLRNSDGKYSKTHPDKRSISEFLVLYEIACAIGERKSMSIEEIIDGENGLAKVYNMSSVLANEILDKLDSHGYLKVDRTAGLDMVYLVVALNAEEIVKDYYSKTEG